jgi:hypothetical protein
MVPQANISSRRRCGEYSGESRRAWMLGFWSSSAKTYVDGEEMACDISSAARLGVLADLESRTKGSRALMARTCSMIVSVKLMERLWVEASTAELRSGTSHVLSSRRWTIARVFGLRGIRSAGQRRSIDRPEVDAEIAGHGASRAESDDAGPKPRRDAINASAWK